MEPANPEKRDSCKVDLISLNNAIVGQYSTASHINVAETNTHEWYPTRRCEHCFTHPQISPNSTQLYRAKPLLEHIPSNGRTTIFHSYIATFIINTPMRQNTSSPNHTLHALHPHSQYIYSVTQQPVKISYSHSHIGQWPEIIQSRVCVSVKLYSKLNRFAIPDTFFNIRSPQYSTCQLNVTDKSLYKHISHNTETLQKQLKPTSNYSSCALHTLFQ